MSLEEACKLCKSKRPAVVHRMCDCDWPFVMEKLLRGFVHFQRRGIYAVAQACFVARTVGEHVAQVRAAAAADNFLPDHSPTGIGARLDVFVVDRFKKTRPA